jgi:hypothetical protein
MFYKERIKELEKRIWELENPCAFKVGEDVDIYYYGHRVNNGVIISINVEKSKLTESFFRNYEVFNSCNKVIKTNQTYYLLKKVYETTNGGVNDVYMVDNNKLKKDGKKRQTKK